MVFAESDWGALKSRIEQLKAERATQKEKFKYVYLVPKGSKTLVSNLPRWLFYRREDRQNYLALHEDCKTIRGQIGVLEKKCQVKEHPSR